MSEAMTQHSTARARSVAFCGVSIALMTVSYNRRSFTGSHALHRALRRYA